MTTYYYGVTGYHHDHYIGSQVLATHADLLQALRKAILRSKSMDDTSADLLAINASQQIENGECIGVELPNGRSLRFLKLRNPITKED